MWIHIAGEVMDEMVEEENSSRYHISADGTEYEVIVKGRQAIKDYLFVRKHQQVEIYGTLKAKKIFSEKTRIQLQKRM